jgi:NAD+ synthase
MDKETCKKISEWINSYLSESGLGALVVGVSGGVDSALVSTLCAMTSRPTYVLNIPIRSKPENSSLSALQCQWLQENYDNVYPLTVDLTDTYEAYHSQVLPHLEPNDLAFANAKARLRMLLLYQCATTHRGLVVGTGNKVEDFGVGFYTKYGDGGVDLSPIADLTKTQVRAAATTVGIPQAILDAPPTDGLWEDSRTDEEQIGASYEELEWAMDYIDNKRSTTLSVRQEEVLGIFTGYRKQNWHKMCPIPVYQLKDPRNVD